MQLVVLASLFLSSALAGVVDHAVVSETIRISGIKPQQEVAVHEDADTKGEAGVQWVVYIHSPTVLTYGGSYSGTTKLSQFANPINYAIFYGASGAWTTSNTVIHRNFLANMGASSYMANARAITGGAGPTYNPGTTATNGNYRIAAGGSLTTQSMVANVFINSVGGATPLPKSLQGIYSIIVSPAMSTPTTLQISSTSQFGNHWCGWHSYTTVTGVTYSYGVTGSSSAAVAGCAAGTSIYGPNGQIDPTLSTVAHEIAESMTDPMTNGYYGWRDFTGGDENGDKCAWYFGLAEYVSGTSGPLYNAVIGGTQFLFQQNYHLATNSCPRQIWY